MNTYIPTAGFADTAFVALVILVWLVGSFGVAGWASHVRGHTWVGTLLVGIFLSPLIAWLGVLGSGTDYGALERRAIRSGRMKRCNDCAELVKADAHVCRHCGHRFSS